MLGLFLALCLALVAVPGFSDEKADKAEAA
jgi:hypothetical protein